MGKMRRMLSMLVMVCMVLLMLPTGAWAAEVGEADGPTLAAAGNNVMLSTGKVTLNWDSTVDDVIAAYGSEKLKTISSYGGSAYTFYGDDYADFLYVETTPEGKIAAFAVFGDFESFVGNSGETPRYTSGSGYNLYVDWMNRKTWAACAICYRNLSSDKLCQGCFRKNLYYKKHTLTF